MHGTHTCYVTFKICKTSFSLTGLMMDYLNHIFYWVNGSIGYIHGQALWIKQEFV